MRGTPVLYKDFHGGLNTVDAPIDLDETEARDVLNVVTTQRGAIQKRNGNQTFSSTAAQFLSLHGVLVPQFLVGASASVVYKVDTGGTATSLKTGLTNGKWELAVATANAGQGPIFLSNGVDAMQTWDGVTAGLTAWTASAGSLPNTSKFILWWKNRMIFAGISGFPHRVTASTIGNPRDFTATTSWSVDLDPDDGQPITGMGTVGAYLLVFKKNKIFVINDSNTGANQRLGVNVGTQAHRSIVETPYGTLFYDDDKGVFQVTPGLALRQLSNKVQATLHQIQHGQLPNVACGYFDNHYYLSFSTAGSLNNFTLDYDFIAQSWWLHSFGVQQFATWEQTLGDPQLYGAHSGANIVDKLLQPGTVQDNGANFSAYWKSPFYTFQSPYVRKRCRRLRVLARGHFAVYTAQDWIPSDSFVQDFNIGAAGTTFGGTGTFGGSGIFGDPANLQSADILTPGVARAWSVVLRSNSADSFEMDALTWALTYRKD